MTTYSNDRTDYPNRGHAIRRSKGISQRVVAIAVGVAPNTVARWERGELVPRKRMQRKLARILGVTVDDLALHNRGDDLHTPTS